jgi:ketosteroid isomerase-like protein
MSTDTDVAAIKSVLEQYASCCRSGDFESWISLWADRGVQMPPDFPARVGKEEVRAAMQPAFAEMTLDLDILSIDNAEVHGDLGLTRCVYSLRLVPKSGGAVIEAVPTGKALTLYDRQPDGGWKISYDCFNADVAPK